MSAQKEQQSIEEFDKRILNAPKQKFKIPRMEPSPFRLEDSEEFILEKQNEYEKLKHDLSDNIENISENEENDEKSESYSDYNEYENNNEENENNSEEDFEENGKIFFSLMKHNRGSTNSKEETDLSSSQKNIEDEEEDNDF